MDVPPPEESLHQGDLPLAPGSKQLSNSVQHDGEETGSSKSRKRKLNSALQYFEFTPASASESTKNEWRCKFCLGAGNDPNRKSGNFSAPPGKRPNVSHMRRHLFLCNKVDQALKVQLFEGSDEKKHFSDLHELVLGTAPPSKPLMKRPRTDGSVRESDHSLNSQLEGGAAHTPDGKMPNVLIVGSGEYVTGFVGTGASKSDKGAGVVFLCFADMRSRGLVGNRIAIAAVRGSKFPAVRKHLKTVIERKYSGLSSTFESFPADHETKPDAFKDAIDTFESGDLCIIFTPDDTHGKIAEYALNRGMHVCCTKPLVHTMHEHTHLERLAEEQQRLLYLEVHKRFDPIYSDARQRVRSLGPFGFMQAYMSQPKSQLETFKAWAGISSDISYYLNSHHIDWHCWAMQGIALPVCVTAMASKGFASGLLKRDVDDSITLMVQWMDKETGSTGTATYTSSWIASESDCHSQQRFFYQAHQGEINVDQAHRGYSANLGGRRALNPLFMNYTQGPEGEFVGQSSYGYISFSKFVEAAKLVERNPNVLESLNAKLPTASSTMLVTAILQAGRESLRTNLPVQILHEGPVPTLKTP